MSSISFGKSKLKKNMSFDNLTNQNNKIDIKFITYKETCGISIALKRYLDCLNESYNCIFSHKETYKKYSNNKITFIFRVCDQDTKNIIEFEKNNDRIVIGIFVWELHTIHDDFINICKLYDHIIVPSCQLKTLFSQYGITNVSTIYHSLPLNHQKLKYTDAFQSIDRNAFIFYSVCTNSCRKNVIALINGFVQYVESTNSNAILVLKIDSIPKNVLKSDKIHYFTSFLKDSEIDYLHNIGDCYVCTSYSEGVNLPMIDAAFSNSFIISSHFGGSIEYFPFSLQISTLLTNNNDDYYYFKKTDQWMEIDIEHYCELLKYVYNNNEELKPILNIQKSHIQSICDPKQIKKQLILVIENFL